jgi:hypothetical protein
MGVVVAACGGGAGPRSDEGVAEVTDETTTTAIADDTAPTTTVPSTTTAESPAPPPAPSTTPGPVASTGRPPSTTAPTAPPATDPRVARVTAADLGASWHTGCPVGPADLRRVTVTYLGFDGAEHDGALIVHADAVQATLQAFDRLRGDRFPIRKIVPVDRYGASDDASMADDNTSAFNCRPSTGSPSTWSQHAYGRAVDVNPLENPYVSSSSVQPPGGADYLERTDVRTGMAIVGGDLVAAFAAVGWGWGGAWSSVKDYQHFSATGR